MYLLISICCKTYILLGIIFAIRFSIYKTENNPKKDKYKDMKKTILHNIKLVSAPIWHTI